MEMQQIQKFQGQTNVKKMSWLADGLAPARRSASSEFSCWFGPETLVFLVFPCVLQHYLISDFSIFWYFWYFIGFVAFCCFCIAGWPTGWLQPVGQPAKTVPRSFEQKGLVHTHGVNRDI